MRHYEKAHRLMGILDYYATRQWLFTDTKVKALMESLTAEDRETFDFDIGRVSWPSYFGTYFLGVRKYIFKEDLASVPAAKRKLSRYPPHSESWPDGRQNRMMSMTAESAERG